MIGRLRDGAIGFLIAILIAAGVCAWRAIRPGAPSIPASPAHELKGETTQMLACKPVVVYREKVAERLGIPAPSGQVTDSRLIAGDEHDHTVTSVYDAGTGRTSIMDRREPLPWLAMERRFGLNAVYGITDRGTTAVRVTGRYDLLRSRELHLGVSGSVQTGGGALVGISIDMH